MKRLFLPVVIFFCFLDLANAQPGELDRSFGENGIVRTVIGPLSDYGSPAITQILVQGDGSIYAIHKSSVTKRKPDGFADPAFGLMVNAYSSVAGFDINKAILLPGGKIVVVGSTDKQLDDDVPSTYSNLAVARINSDGSLDSSFGGDGKKVADTKDYSGYDVGYAAANQKDGKIVVAGITNDNVSLFRFNEDGNLDTTFASSGFLYTNIGYSGRPPLPTSIVVQGDGKILVTGNYFSHVLRFNTDGSTDLTFNQNQIHQFEKISATLIQSDGKILIAGYTSGVSAMARFEADGNFDKNFGVDGKKILDFEVNSLTLQGNGKIIAAGISTLARYNTNGSADTTFSGDGQQSTDSVGIASIAVENDGKIVAAGGNIFVRYKDDGSIDKSFGISGKVKEVFLLGSTAFYKTVTQKDGKIIATGKTWNGKNSLFVVVRYNTDGSLDKTFSDDGIKTVTFTGNNVLKSLAIQNDGKIVAAGGFNIVRFKTDGTLDSALGSVGKQTTDVYINAVSIQSDGKIVAAAGDTGSGNSIVARYNTDGSLDKTFGINGKQIIDF